MNIIVSEFKRERPFPKLMINETTGTIALFTGPLRGVVLQCKNGSHGVGEFKDNWCKEFFEDFNGHIILEN